MYVNKVWLYRHIIHYTQIFHKIYFIKTCKFKKHINYVLPIVFDNNMLHKMWLYSGKKWRESGKRYSNLNGLWILLGFTLPYKYKNCYQKYSTYTFKMILPHNIFEL